LGLVENGMRTASADGKLPLVGSDLQQGADFVGTLRGQLQTEVWSKLPNNGDIPNAGELQSFLNQKLATAITLPDNYLHGSGLTITLTCTDGTTSAPCAASDPLTKVSGATVTFDVGAGKISTTQGCVDDADATIGNCYGTTIPVDL